MKVTDEQLIRARNAPTAAHLVPETDEDYFMLAYQSYNNPQCAGLSEFRDDLNRTEIISRMLKRYVSKGELNIRLILNNLIILFNLFGSDGAALLISKLVPSEYPAALSLLRFISCYPPGGLASLGIDVSEPEPDPLVTQMLKDMINGR